MKLTVLILSILASAAAMAHIEPGVWKGSVSASADCFMEVGAQTFENNLKHPLNERIQIKIGSTDFSVHHPYSINSTTGEVGFNHDLFEAVAPTKTGSYALVIQMAHTDEFEGPTSFDVMEHNWKSGAIEVVHCKDIKHVSK